MHLTDDIPPEVAEMLAQAAPRPARTALGHIAANGEMARAVQEARAAGDDEWAAEMLRQPRGTMPVRRGQSFPPRG